MNDDANGKAGEQASEEARRYYREKHGATGAEAPGETVIPAPGSSYGARQTKPSVQAGARDGSLDPKKEAPRDKPASIPKQDDSSRALGESDTQGSEGPHILDKSFSGTYKD